MGITRDIFIDQGASFLKQFAIHNPIGSTTPFDLTGCTILGTMKTIPESTVIIAELFCDIVDDPEDGVISISLTPDETATIKPRKYVYDVIAINPDSNFYRIVEGIAIVSPGVTLDI